jgi:ChpA-C
MTKTKKFVLAAGLSAALAVMGAGPAVATGNQGSGDRQDGSRHQEHKRADRDRANCLNKGGARANGFAANSPGILSGNVIQIPVDIPINICGNSINIVGLLNPVSGGGGGGGGNN